MIAFMIKAVKRKILEKHHQYDGDSHVGKYLSRPSVMHYEECQMFKHLEQIQTQECEKAEVEGVK